MKLWRNVPDWIGKLLSAKRVVWSLRNQMSEEEKKKLIASTKALLRKLGTFIAVAVFLYWIAPEVCEIGDFPSRTKAFPVTFLAFGLGWVFGNHKSEQDGYKKGTIEGVQDLRR